MLDEFLKIKKDFCIPHIGAILVELHNRYNINQFKIVLDYLDSMDEFKQKCVIENIHLFNFTTEEIKVIFGRFNKLLNHSIEIDKSIIYESQNEQKQWTMPIKNWNLTLSQLAIFFEGRLEEALKL